MSLRTPLPPSAGDYWQHRQSANRSTDKHEDIYLKVGHALSTWESFEYTLVMLFCHFVEAKINNAAQRAFGSISASNARMEALDKAAQVYFHLHGVNEGLQDQFNLLRKHADRARERRNDIAHGVVNSVGVQGDPNVGGVFLIPAMYSSRKIAAFHVPSADPLSFLKGSYRLTAQDIDVIIGKFNHLQVASGMFFTDLVTAFPP